MTREHRSRRGERQPIELVAQCRTQSGLRDRGLISDISPEGCCITTNDLFVKIGTRVMIRPDGLEALTGIIRWIDGNRAGIEFDRPLYGPVVDHLVRTHAQSGRSLGISRY